MSLSSKIFPAFTPSAPARQQYDELSPPDYALLDESKAAVPVTVFQSAPLDMKTMPSELQAHHGAAQAELKKMGAARLGGKFQVALALDISRSMQHQNYFFFNPYRQTEAERYPLQQLINQVLSMGYLLDDDSFVTLFPFGDQAYGPIRVNHSNYETITEHFYKEDSRDPARNPPIINYLKDHTDYTSAINAITDFYTRGKTDLQIRSMDPVLVIFVTDGHPNPMLKDDPQLPHHPRAEFQPYPVPSPKPKNETDALAEIQNAFARTSRLPMYFVVVGFEGNALRHIPKAEQFVELKEAANRYKQDRLRIPQNIDLLLLDHPEDLEMHHFVRKLPHWLIQAYNQRITTMDVRQLMDMKTFNNYENSFKSCWARMFCCVERDEYQLVHHGHEHEHEDDHVPQHR